MAYSCVYIEFAFGSRVAIDAVYRCDIEAWSWPLFCIGLDVAFGLHTLVWKLHVHFRLALSQRIWKHNSQLMSSSMHLKALCVVIVSPAAFCSFFML
ncbi:unnamed protein product [Lathyrus oleraceus]